MEALATIVFERTPLGAVVIKSTGNEVPQRLRTLLLAVDGRSPVAQYVPFLTAFAPLSEKFAELETMGYLRRKGHVGIDAVQRFERAQAAGPAATLPRIDTGAPESGFTPLDESALSAFASSMGNQPDRLVATADAFMLELQALSRQLGSNAATAGNGAPAKVPFVEPSPRPESRTATLNGMLEMMEQFLSRSAGLEGLPVALLLEQIRTLDQLRSELPAYFELVQPYGKEAEAHIESLRQMLRES